jgi:hypothetical protein
MQNTCTPERCITEEFRREHPNYSFTTIGYGYPPKELVERYLELVDISYDHCYRGTDESHHCKLCEKEVYNRIHR